MLTVFLECLFQGFTALFEESPEHEAHPHSNPNTNTFQSQMKTALSLFLICVKNQAPGVGVGGSESWSLLLFPRRLPHTWVAVVTARNKIRKKIMAVAYRTWQLGDVGRICFMWIKYLE